MQKHKINSHVDCQHFLGHGNDMNGAGEGTTSRHITIIDDDDGAGEFDAHSPQTNTVSWNNRKGAAAKIARMTRQLSRFVADYCTVGPGESKAWIVPRIDTRNIVTHRHAKETAFPTMQKNELPEFVEHVKQLWEKSYHNENNQQPMRPASLAADSVVRALGHASIQTGWEHLKASFHQMSKACQPQLVSGDETESFFLLRS
jgi:hypothetical protein